MSEIEKHPPVRGRRGRDVARMHDERERENERERKQLHESREDRPDCTQSPARDWPLLLCLLLLLLMLCAPLLTLGKTLEV